MLKVNLQDAGQLCHVGMLVNRDKDFVEQSLKIVSLDSVHDKPLQRGHHNGVSVCYRDVEVDQTAIVQLCVRERELTIVSTKDLVCILMAFH